MQLPHLPQTLSNGILRHYSKISAPGSIPGSLVGDPFPIRGERPRGDDFQQAPPQPDVVQHAPRAARRLLSCHRMFRQSSVPLPRRLLNDPRREPLLEELMEDPAAALPALLPPFVSREPTTSKTDVPIGNKRNPPLQRIAPESEPPTPTASASGGLVRQARQDIVAIRQPGAPRRYPATRNS